MPTYSHSKLSTFETCPLQYKFAYIDRIKREEEGIEAFMGSRFHDAMERLYGELRYRVMPLEELIRFYEEKWVKEYHDDVVITNKKRTADDYRGLGRKCIESYYRRYHPFAQGTLLGLEKKVDVDLLGDGKYRIIGYIDRLMQLGNGRYEIHDYKTSGSLPEQRRLDEDRQLALYNIAVRKMWPDVEGVSLCWHYVVFDKEMTSSRTEKQLEKLKDNTIALIDRIEATRVFEPRESALCDWCSYQDLCPKRKHLCKVESLPINEYLNDDGVRLVNEFARLTAEKMEQNAKIDKIDEELDKIKEAAVAYAKKRDVELIRGSDHKLRVTEKTVVSAPTKDSPERGELEALLKRMGKWDALSMLDTHALAAIVMERALDTKSLSQLQNYLTIEKRYYIYLSLLRENED